MAVFLTSGLLVLSLVGGVLAVVQHRSAVREAVREARTLTELQAANVVEPVLTDAALRPGAAQDALDRLVRERVLGSEVVRVKLWDAEGRVVYSDDRELVGRRFTLLPDELGALGPGGEPFVQVREHDELENARERALGTLLQVYLGVQTVEGTPLLYETYQPYGTIDAASRRLWRQALPVLLGALALLWLAQAPLAWRLATRLRRAQEQREQLLLANLAASDRERRRIAADLHDGVVQSLSGTSLTLSAAANRSTLRGDPDGARMLHAAAVDLRRSVRELRSLVVTITPPGLAGQALVPSLHDLVAPLQDRGIDLSLSVDDVELDGPTRDLVLRAVQEAVRNILRHAAASAATVQLSRQDDEVVLDVCDDGAGFPAGNGPPDGMGLTLLGGLAEQHGGRLQVSSAPGQGTRLVLRLPLPRTRVPV